MIKWKILVKYDIGCSSQELWMYLKISNDISIKFGLFIFTVQSIWSQSAGFGGKQFCPYNGYLFEYEL